MKNIESKIQELFNSAPMGVNGISFGFKTKNNETTNELSFIYNVEKKLSKELVDKNNLIPEKITLDNQEYKTDVVEISLAHILACYSFQDNPSPIVLEHRKKVRPLKGGISVTNSAYCGYYDIGSGSNYIRPYKYGTLGAIVVDNLTNTLVGLTAGHIVAKDITFGHTRNFNQETYYNIYTPQEIPTYYENNNGNLVLSEGLTENKYNQVLIQFNESGEYANINSSDVIGEPKRYIPAYPGNTSGNVADAGIFTLKPGSIGIPNSNQQLGLTGTSGLLFANSVEIFDALTGRKNLYSAGRTTGPKGEFCPLVINNLFGLAAVGGYEINGVPNQNLRFQNILGISYLNNTSFPAAEGDSGSVIYGEFSGINKIVGLIFAGSTAGTNNIAYACPMDQIATGLNISPWTGDIKNFDNKAERKTVLKNKTETGVYISELGATYNQVGIISSYVPPESEEESDDITIKSNDMYVDNLFIDIDKRIMNDPCVQRPAYIITDFGASILANYGAIIPEAIDSAKITYQIQVFSTFGNPYSFGGSFCCEESFCFNEDNFLIDTITSTVSSSNGIMRVRLVGGASCFLFKILNIEKNGYNFRPDISSKLELISKNYLDCQLGMEKEEQDNNDEIILGKNGNEGDLESSATGGDTENANQSFRDFFGNEVSTGGSDSGGSGGTRDPADERSSGCCDQLNIADFDGTTFNVNAVCKKYENRMRVALIISVGLPKTVLLNCNRNNIQFTVRTNIFPNPIGLPWYVGGNQLGYQGASKEIEIPPEKFKKITENPSASFSLEISSRYNTTDQCTDKNLKNQTLRITYKDNKDFLKIIKWDNQINGENEVAGPHCYGEVLITFPQGGSALVPAPCCDCCEELIDQKQTWLDQCYPSFTTWPTCKEDQGIIYYDKPVWVSNSQDRCKVTNRIVNRNIRRPIKKACEKGIQDCWPCRPVSCIECSIGVGALELLNIEPLGLQNLVDNFELNNLKESLDEKFKKQILQDLNV
jgi:hypothetical protein